MLRSILISSLMTTVLVQSIAAATQPLERYQSIIDRQMFGRPPAGFDPEKMPSEVSRTSEKELSKEQEKLQASVRFSGIRVSPDDEVYVSFSDIADPKNPRSYYLKVGESSGGWTVTAADPVKATMTVVKDEVEVSLSIGGSSTGKDGASAVSRAGSSSPSAGARGNSSLLSSLSARRRRRQEERDAQQREAEKRQAERDAQRDQELAQEREQREAERAEQRKQLQAIQEELRKSREKREAEEKEKPSDEADES